MKWKIIKWWTIVQKISSHMYCIMLKNCLHNIVKKFISRYTALGLFEAGPFEVQIWSSKWVFSKFSRSKSGLLKPGRILDWVLFELGSFVVQLFEVRSFEVESFEVHSLNILTVLQFLYVWDHLKLCNSHVRVPLWFPTWFLRCYTTAAATIMYALY